jgi:Flp pilus assembly protein TadG
LNFSIKTLKLQDLTQVAYLLLQKLQGIYREDFMYILKSRKGISLVLVSIAMFVIIGMAALSVDVGNAYYQRSNLEKATDLAALAAAQKMKTTDDDSAIQQSAYHVFAENGLDPEQADITVNITKGSETALVNSNLTVPFYFAKILGFDKIDLKANSVAEVLPDGSSRLINGSTYDLVPWGIPDGETSYNTDNDELDIDGTDIYDWNRDPNFEFQVGKEYLLKLGQGQASDGIGRKILIPMDGSEDVYPSDSDDPIFPEYGDRTQSEYLQAYGLVYWCLEHGYHVDWLLDYDGGSFLVDYHDDINNAVSDTGLDLSGVSKVVLNASQAAKLNNWLASHNDSEGRPYEIVPMDHPFQIAVFTQKTIQSTCNVK